MSSDDEASAYEVAACALLTIARGGKILIANRAACAWTGFTREELLARRFQDLLTVGSKVFHQTHWMPLLEMQGSVAEVQLEILRHDKRIVPVLVNAAKRAQDERIDVAIFAATDRRNYERELLFARRRAEALELDFRTLAENSPDLIVRCDAKGRCLYVNPMFERLTGLRVEALVGKTMADVGVRAPLLTSWTSALEKALAGTEATQTLNIDAPDGTRRELDARLVPERDAGGAVTSVLAIARDVTSLRESEREAQQRAAFAEQLIGIVSHDLRNPLNAITVGTQVLASMLEDKPRSVVDKISSAADRANRLITDLLDFTRARVGGGLGIRRQNVDLHVLVAHVLDEIRLASPKRIVEHHVVGSGTADADPDRIGQVVTNLVGNALAYGDLERPVTVTTVVAEQLEVRVHNEGPAIPLHIQPEIFEPMRRGEDPSRGSSRSIGLGLYIVREIAVAHGGSVEVRSLDGEGTTFTVRLSRS